VNAQEGPPQFLLIVRELLRPGSSAAYNANELQFAAACATLKCPHPYLALVSVDNAREIWWQNAFASREERDGLDALATSNLLAALLPLGKRKEDFRAAVSTIRTTYRPDVSSQTGVTIAGARVLVVIATKGQDILRIRYHDIRPDRFSWTADRSTDGGKTWVSPYQRIEARRIGAARSLGSLAPARK